MKGFEDLQQLWHRQTPEPNVSFDTILKRIKESKGELAKKLFWQSVVVAAAIIVLLLVWVAVSFSTWTTYLALALTMGCICYFFVNQLADYRRISSSHSLLSKPQEYIVYLQEFKQKRNRFNTRNYMAYEIVLAVAFGLYAVEMYFSVPFWAFITFLLVVVCWFLICHFVFMKQYIKQENARIQEMIDNLGRINKQFHES
ncbi:hypothetical protein [Parapedobacter lycopersici]|uniref:hypothetical protein n=1 Tax=Parapedobacter lycopersici TaxID=1864939 RepID=UPI00214DBFEE|nr:hypothetical protein [Parapedobacter lycopersici]